MTIANIHRLTTAMQYRHGGKFTVQGLAFTRLVHNIIREYGNYHDGSYSVCMSDIDTYDQRLLLSHILDAEEYRHICKSIPATEEAWKENMDHLSGLIESECDEVYRDDMEDMGMIMNRHRDNNEIYWTKR